MPWGQNATEIKCITYTLNNEFIEVARDTAYYINVQFFSQKNETVRHGIKALITLKMAAKVLYFTP